MKRNYLRGFKEEKLVSVKNVQKAKITFKEYAQAALTKAKNINIRLS